MRTCQRCKEEKSEDSFYVHSGNTCKQCKCEVATKHNKKNRTKEYYKEYYSKNKHVYEKARKKWTSKPEVKARLAAKQKMRDCLKKSPISEQYKDEIELFYIHAKECEMLTGDRYDVDHIVPLQGENVCGLHVPWNLQVLPKDINIQKGNSYVEL